MILDSFSIIIYILFIKGLQISPALNDMYVTLFHGGNHYKVIEAV